MGQPLIITSWPRAILHIDGDAFFASCEQALHPEYKGKPVITGKERGIVACPSYEAKQRGVKRVMRLYDAKKICPEAIIVPSDYESYSLFSKRMFDMVRKFSPMVEEYSIDEGFADITGLRRPLNKSYQQIAAAVKDEIEKSLGISVSVGLSLNKSLAKLASNNKKPSGLTIVPGYKVHLLLEKIPLEKIWGIGPATTAYLEKLGIKTALQFARQRKEFIEERLTKPGVEIWQELNGQHIYKIDSKLRSDYKSISKSKTFTPPQSDKEFVYAQLVRNLESACIKARRYSLAARKVYLILKSQDFKSQGLEIRLSRPTAYPLEMTPLVKEAFEKIFKPKSLYRATGVVLADLQSTNTVQFSLFDSPVKVKKTKALFDSIDKTNFRFGKHTVSLASTLPVNLQKKNEGERGDVPVRRKIKIEGERGRQRLAVPYLFVKV